MKFHSSSANLETFSEMNFSELLLKSLDQFSITKPTEIQSKAIPVILTGADILAVAQTGSGKTLAYALSLVMLLEKNKNERALVLVPSREMAEQIHSVFTKIVSEFNISTCLVIGGIPNAIQISQLKKNPRIIVATPGRLNDHLVQNKLLLQNVEFVVLDEADRMIDLGFSSQLKSIQKTLRGDWQTLLFSATFDASIETIAQWYMKENAVLVRTNQAELAVSSLKQKIVFLERKDKDWFLLEEIEKAKKGILIFTGSQQSCERLGHFLNAKGYGGEIIHGDLTQGHRTRVLREFRQQTIQVLVATDLLARGLDIPHVDCVINYDLPFQSEDFLHRIGRTARAGRPGYAMTLITADDAEMYSQLKAYVVGAEQITIADGSALKSSELLTKARTEKPRTDKYRSKKNDK